MPKKQLQGIVTSNKMLKTLVVEVESIKVHPKYKKRFKVHQKYKAHVEDGAYSVGDRVLIEECRPISRDKRWKVIKRVDEKSSDEAVDSSSSASASGGLDI